MPKKQTKRTRLVDTIYHYGISIRVYENSDGKHHYRVGRDVYYTITSAKAKAKAIADSRQTTDLIALGKKGKYPHGRETYETIKKVRK